MEPVEKSLEEKIKMLQCSSNFVDLSDLEIAIFKGISARPNEQMDNKRRYFENGEIIVISEITFTQNNAMLQFEHDDNLEIWYSQLTQEAWNKYGTLMPCYLRIGENKYDLCHLSSRDFKKNVIGIPLKVRYEETCYYYAEKYDYWEQIWILDCFRHQELKKITKLYKFRKLYSFEAVNE